MIRLALTFGERQQVMESNVVKTQTTPPFPQFDRRSMKPSLPFGVSRPKYAGPLYSMSLSIPGSCTALDTSSLILMQCTCATPRLSIR